jgi:hypothetical protein
MRSDIVAWRIMWYFFSFNLFKTFGIDQKLFWYSWNRIKVALLLIFLVSWLYDQQMLDSGMLMLCLIMFQQIERSCFNNKKGDARTDIFFIRVPIHISIAFRLKLQARNQFFWCLILARFGQLFIQFSTLVDASCVLPERVSWPSSQSIPGKEILSKESQPTSQESSNRRSLQ